MILHENANIQRDKTVYQCASGCCHGDSVRVEEEEEKKQKNQRRDSRELCPFAAFFSQKGTSLWFLRAIIDLLFVLVQEDFYVISLVCFRRGPYCQKCFQECIQKVTISRALLRGRSKRISSVCCCCLVHYFACSVDSHLRENT